MKPYYYISALYEQLCFSEEENMMFGKCIKALSMAGVIFVSQLAFAQSGSWNSTWTEASSHCVTNNSASSNLALLSDPDASQGNNPQQVNIAHRGVFMRATPDGKYPAENSLLAFRLAQCRGYAGVEIDLKVTSDGELIMSHENSLGRVTNADARGGTIYPETNMTIKNGNTYTRENVWHGTAKISDLNWAYIEQRATEYKTYDNNGHFNSKRARGSSNAMKFETLLLNKNSMMLDKLIFVLDIQNYRQFQKAIKVVGAHNAWDRVIFKVWSEAMPICNLSTGSPQACFSVDSSVTWNFVTVHNGMNVKLVDETATGGARESKFLVYDKDRGDEVWVNGANNWFIYNSLAQLDSFGKFNWIGHETFVGANADMASAVKTYSDYSTQCFVPGNPQGTCPSADPSSSYRNSGHALKQIGNYSSLKVHPWGVGRQPDYKRLGQNGTAQFPAGDYYAGDMAVHASSHNKGAKFKPVLYTITPAEKQARDAMAATRRIITYDHREF